MAGRELLAHRRAVGCLVAIAALATVGLGVRYAGQGGAGRLDTAIDARVQLRLSAHLRFLHHLVALGDPASVVALCVVLITILLLTGRRRAAVLSALGPAVATGFTEFVLKPLIGRRLDDSLSFPSGHTTGAVSVAVVVMVVLLGPSRPGWPWLVRWAASGLALLAAVAVATALVGSGYHYATDTLGGFGVAFGVVLSVAVAIDAVCVRSKHESSRERRTRQPV